MELEGDHLVARENEVEDSGTDRGDDCYFLQTDSSTYVGNEAEGCTGSGFALVDNSDVILTDNEAEDNAQNCFEITSGSAILADNEAEDNGRFDLCDQGDTTDGGGNDFGTTSSGDCN
jgi:parallel beta-helix repeat protein